jgi:hypothetical protein
MVALSHIESSGLFHWIAAIVGIICFLMVRLFRIKNFSAKMWVNENLIGSLWSLFFLSLTVLLTHEYYPAYSIHEAFLTGYSGTHLIFRMNKEPKPRKQYTLKKPHNN